MGYLEDMPVNSYPVAAYFEAHIEQGPVLHDHREVIGVVNCAQKQFWYNLRLTGQEAHAGPTPMPSRRDAMVAAARMVLEFDRIGRKYPDARPEHLEAGAHVLAEVLRRAAGHGGQPGDG